jgi:hypothetical protein
MVLPDKIYLMNSDGQYYSCSGGVVTVEKTFPDSSCMVTVEYLPNNPNEFYLRTCEGAYFQYHKLPRKGNHIDHKVNPKEPKKRPITFSLLDLEEEDTFIFRSSNGAFMTLRVNAKNRITLGGFEHAKIKVGDPAIKKLITNLAYDLETSTITDLSPEVVLKTAVRNDSPSDSFQTITYSYIVSNIGSWTNRVGAALPPNVVGSQIPCLVDGIIAIAQNYSEMLSKFETKTATSTISVSAKTKGVATVLIYKAIIHVPFTYTEQIWYQSGSFEKLSKQGAYKSNVTYGVDIELTDLISLNHTY